MPYTVNIEAQPIADQLMIRCSCGWSSTVSLYDYERRSPQVAERRAQEHLAQHAIDDVTERDRLPAKPSAQHRAECDCREFIGEVCIWPQCGSTRTCK